MSKASSTYRNSGHRLIAASGRREHLCIDETSANYLRSLRPRTLFHPMGRPHKKSSRCCRAGSTSTCRITLSFAHWPNYSWSSEFKTCKFTSEAIVSPKVMRRVNFARYAAIRLAPSIILRSKPAATMGNGKKNRKNGAETRQCPTRQEFAF